MEPAQEWTGPYSRAIADAVMQPGGSRKDWRLGIRHSVDSARSKVILSDACQCGVATNYSCAILELIHSPHLFAEISSGSSSIPARLCHHHKTGRRGAPLDRPSFAHVPV